MVQLRSLLPLAAAGLASASLSVPFPYQPSGPRISIKALYANGQDVFFDIGSGVFGAVTDLIDAASFTYDTATGYIFVGATTGVPDYTLLTVPDTILGISTVVPSLESVTALTSTLHPLQCTLGTADANGIAAFNCLGNLPSPLNSLCVNIVAGVPIFVAYQDNNFLTPITCSNPIVSLNAYILPEVAPCSVTVQVTVETTTQYVSSGFVPPAPTPFIGPSLASYGCTPVTTILQVDLGLGKKKH